MSQEIPINNICSFFGCKDSNFLYKKRILLKKKSGIASSDATPDTLFITFCKKFYQYSVTVRFSTWILPL